jgi:hypothetical protein
MSRWIGVFFGSAHRSNKLRFIWTLVVGAFFVVGLIALNELMFRWLFDTSYTRWYLANGSLIGLVFAAFTVVWGDVNKLTGLISAHPYEYFANCLGLGAFPIRGSGALTAPRSEEPATQDEASEESQPLPAPIGLGLIDWSVAALFALVMMVLYFSWLLVVAPLQFVVNLLAGVPARSALASSERAWALVTGREVLIDASLKSEPLPQGAVESGFTTRPVTFTAVIAAALLFIVNVLS